MEMERSSMRAAAFRRGAGRGFRDRTPVSHRADRGSGRGMAVDGSEPAAAAAQASEDRLVAESIIYSVAAASSSSVSGTPPTRLDLNKVREANIFAIFQAQHDGCLMISRPSSSL
ncbi:hypothetical protein GUJ93_ZPchr0007g5027 [Zizania palustris]|uniref:Uncharacterized protein n=1 Tax=Zizania palustris TaxID=103762 RepID=A0A8J5T3D6_ZIZPA|nr:hypothetical protein GUJ93_ZPchr0007g5027 [Zizania palustris]